MIFPCTIITGHTIEAINQKITSLALSADNEFKANNPDLFIINQDTGWKIETVRDLIKFFSRKPYRHSSKIALIYQADQLSLEAQSVLLKTLEEPGEGNYIILTTFNANSLLPTIISRSHIINTTDISINNSIQAISLSNNLSDNLETVNQLLSLYDKSNLIDWLDGQIDLIRPQLKTNSVIKSAALITKLTRAKEMLQANVEARSVLDWIFIS